MTTDSIEYMFSVENRLTMRFRWNYGDLKIDE